MSDWFRISSSEFKNADKFPPIPLPDYSTATIKLNKHFYRINTAYKKGTKIPPSKYFFWFRYSNKNFYYTQQPTDLHVLGSIAIKQVSDVLPNGPFSDEPFCFSVIDQENHKWKLCAIDMDTKNNWICKIREELGQSVENCKSILLSDGGVTIITQKITQPIILVPLPTKNCNENWDYSRSGSDWQCDCIEGKEQSPINIDTKKKVLSPVKPLFNYEEVLASQSQLSENGDTMSNEFIKIQLIDSILTIKDVVFGKVVTLDGSVYLAKEIKFHTPSEHTINGKSYDMEMQVIHYGQTKGDIAKQLVLSFLFEKKPGAYNKFIDDIDFFNLPSPVHRERDILNNLYLPKIFYSANDDGLPIMKPFSFFTYQGSLSSPPCTERTIHYVMENPIPLGTTALHMFKESIKLPDMMDTNGNIIQSNSSPTNNRKTQALNGRHVYYYDSVKFEGPEPPMKPKPKKKGHFEKIVKYFTNYYYVNDDKASGLPGAFVVSSEEAKGN